MFLSDDLNSAIGHDAVISPFWGHALQLWIGSKIPAFIANWGIMKMHLGLRKRSVSIPAFSMFLESFFAFDPACCLFDPPVCSGLAKLAKQKKQE